MKKNTLFKCTQQELYLASPLAWDLCSTNLSRFTKLKGFYTEGFINDRLAEIEAAKAIPNHKIRKDMPTTNRMAMDDAIEECIYYFTLLKALINSAFEGDAVAAKLDSAGVSFFDKSVTGNEGALEDLNTSALAFVKTNEVALKANNNMNDDFLGEYQDVVADYNAQRKNYATSYKAATETTVDNTTANNNIYKAIMDMIADARAIFRKEPELRDQFSFTAFLDQVVSSSVAGIRGKVTILDSKKGINKVKIRISGKDKVFETNKLGKFDVAQLANGKYNITFSCAGYKDIVVMDYEVKTGVYNTLNVAMEAMEVPVAATA
jgi:hypothetical protein